MYYSHLNFKVVIFQVTNLCKWSSLLQWFMKIRVCSGTTLRTGYQETGKSEASVAEKCFLNGWLVYQKAENLRLLYCREEFACRSGIVEGKLYCFNDQVKSTYMFQSSIPSLNEDAKEDYCWILILLVDISVLKWIRMSSNPI